MNKIFVRENPLLDSARAFALRIVDLYKQLRNDGETVMSKQVLRSGTSIGANIAEAQYAQSRADFAAKLSIALKEASETLYWIDLLVASGTVSDSVETKSLMEDCSSLLCMLIASVKKSKTP